MPGPDTDNEPQETTPPKPPANKPPKEKPAPKKAPFAALAKEVDLLELAPPQSSTEMVELGSIDIAENDLMFIALIGGAKAYKKDHVFELRNARGGTAEREWEFVLSSGVGGEKLIAEMVLEDKKLKFHWTPEAADAMPASGYLTNCSMTLSAGPDTHTLLLRSVGKLEPMPLTLNSPVITEKYTIPSPPNPEGIQVEILGVDNAPKPVFEGPQILPAQQGELWMVLGQTPEEQAAAYKIDTKMTTTGQLTITATAYINFPSLRGRAGSPIARSFRPR